MEGHHQGRDIFTFSTKDNFIFWFVFPVLLPLVCLFALALLLPLKAFRLIATGRKRKDAERKREIAGVDDEDRGRGRGKN